MKVLITESQKKGVILNLIRDKGWEDASSVFGGLYNLITILGTDVLSDFLLKTYFDDLKLGKYGRSLTVDEGYLTIMEKPSSFWSSDIRVYDAYLRSVLSEIPEPLYLYIRKDLIKKIISMFPQLSDATGVDVFEDQGLYKKHESFELNN